jgi:hypothetical protein
MYASNLPPEEKRSNRNVASGSSSNENISNNCTSKNCVTVPEMIIQHEVFSFLLSEFLSCPFVDDMVSLKKFLLSGTEYSSVNDVWLAIARSRLAKMLFVLFRACSIVLPTTYERIRHSKN